MQVGITRFASATIISRFTRRSFCNSVRNALWGPASFVNLIFYLFAVGPHRHAIMCAKIAFIHQHRPIRHRGSVTKTDVGRCGKAGITLNYGDVMDGALLS